MNCDQEMISRFLDGDSTDREEPSLFAHLAVCSVCRNFLHDVNQVRSEILRSAPPEPAAALDRRVLAIPYENRQPQRRPFPLVAALWSRRLVLPVPAAAAALLTLLLTTAIAGALWLRPSAQTEAAEARYIIGLPTVEVRAVPPTAAKSPN